MNHQIIRSPDSLREFIDWLPELRPTERYFLCLQARKKYLPTLRSSDKTQLKRFVSRKETLFDKIYQLHVPIGAFTTKTGEVIPDEAIALYITANPRCMRKATFRGAKELISLLEHDQQRDLNPHSAVLSQIHKAKSRSAFVHFDIDIVTGDEQDENAPKSSLTVKQAYDKTVQTVGQEAVTLIETRGGFHVLVDPQKVVSETKNWHPIIVRELSCDQTGDLMIPVVGCCQGGFVPKFYTPELLGRLEPEDRPQIRL